jgi:hypothetical protein
MYLAQPLSCSNSSFICKNGATCVDLNVPEKDFFGFRCDCSLGYYGELCDKSIVHIYSKTFKNFS